MSLKPLPVSVFGVPTDVGAGRRGASMGPEALRVAGLVEALVGRGVDAVDRGDVAGPRNPWQAPVDGYRHLDEVVAWNQQAEFVSRYFRKGQLVAVCGRIQTRSWTDNNGNNRNAVEVVADEVHFAEPKRDNYDSAPAMGGRPQGGYNQGGYNQGGYNQAPGRPSPAAANVGDGFMNIPDSVDDEELPFN